MGQTLVNHSYVDLSTVGYISDGSNSVQCHTDLRTCCSSAQGIRRGDWYFPNGTRLPLFTAYRIPFGETRTAQKVDISVTIPVHKLVSIVVIFQLKLSMPSQ